MISYDPIPCIEAMGYTEREASFLYLVATGTYIIQAQVGSGSGAQTANTEVAAQVLSVSPGSNGIMLNLQGLGQVSLSQVQQIN